MVVECADEVLCERRVGRLIRQMDRHFGKHASVVGAMLLGHISDGNGGQYAYACVGLQQIQPEEKRE